MGMLKMEQRLGSSAVGPPPLIMITLCTRSGYSWARKVQKETLGAGMRKSELAGHRQRFTPTLITRQAFKTNSLPGHPAG